MTEGAGANTEFPASLKGRIEDVAGQSHHPRQLVEKRIGPFRSVVGALAIWMLAAPLVVRADARGPSTRSATAAMKSAAAWQVLLPEACVSLSVEDRARLPRPWKPYVEAVRRCELAAPGAQSQIALISVFAEEYYRGRPSNAPWEDFPKPLLVDRDFRCVGGLRELFPHDQPRALTLRVGLWRKGIPQEIRGQVDDPAVGGGYVLPVLRWSEVDHRYREASGAVSSDSSCSHF